MNIFLVGYRCTGKSSLGRALARKNSLPFVEIDDVLVSETGMNIAGMVSEKGWSWFRQKEREIIRRVCSASGQVVATGGGAVLDAENVRDMKNSGKVIWLRATPANIIRRIRQDPMTRDTRPALTSRNLKDEIRETLSERLPLYRNAADAVVDTDWLTLEQLTDMLDQTVKKFPEFRALF